MTEERRSGTFRRQVNDALMGEDGSFSIRKIIAVAAQGVLLYKLGTEFVAVINDWAIFGLVIAALIMPDLLAKLLVMKFGGVPAAGSVSTTTVTEPVQRVTKTEVTVPAPKGKGKGK